MTFDEFTDDIVYRANLARYARHQAEKSNQALSPELAGLKRIANHLDDLSVVVRAGYDPFGEIS